jgi:hypothetical protein
MTEISGTPALYGVDDRTIECRGGRHRFPEMGIRKIPKGITFVPQHDGSYQIRSTCPNCGRWRVKTTLPGGGYDRNAVYQYGGGPEDFSAKEDTERGKLSKADYAAELHRRVAEAGAFRTAS